MGNGTKKWFAAGASLAAVGVVLFAAAMTAYHWDFSRLSTERYETNTYEIREEFVGIEMDTENADILFAASGDGICRVVCREDSKMKHSVGVQKNTLIVCVTDDRAWYDRIGISLQSPEITVYLPKTEYDSILIKANAGNVEISNEMKVRSAAVSLHSGTIQVDRIAADTLELSSSTGDTAVSDVTCTGDIRINTDTGTVRVQNAACQNLFSTGSAGDISLKRVAAAEKCQIERSTGNVVFDNSDVAEISVKTDTGNVTGSLLSQKVFLTESSSGSISVPKTTAGGKCEIITATGDINMEIAPIQ